MRIEALQLAEKVLAGAEDPGFVGAPAFRPVKLRQKRSGLQPRRSSPIPA
jgi:hypothetical protein